MNKEWHKIDESKYAFSIDGKTIGTMSVNYRSMSYPGTFIIDDTTYKFIKKGFAKTTIEITGGNNELLIRIFPEKWYKSTFLIEYKSKKYKLLVRNNPLSEWVILDGEKEILAYGLGTGKNKNFVRITGTERNPDPIWDFILWYLFAPVAKEQMADNLEFLIFLTA